MVQRLIALLRRPFSRRGSRKPFWERPVPEEDPIVNSSLAVPMAVSSLLLMVTLIWAFYDEGWGLRPWRAHQDEFVERYSTFLRGLKPRQASQEEEIKASEGYQDLLRQQQEAEADVTSPTGGDYGGGRSRRRQPRRHRKDLRHGPERDSGHHLPD